MKKLILGLMALMIMTVAYAQDGTRAQRQASRALGAYRLDPTNNKAKLQEAVEEIKIAEEDPVSAALARTWVTKGEVFNEIVGQIVGIRQFGMGDESELPKLEKPALQAAEAFFKAFELAEKKFEKRDALRGLQAVQGNLSNMGIYAYEAGEFGAAYHHFKMVLDAHDLLEENKESSALQSEEDVNNQLYITGLAALNAEKPEEAKGYFQRLYDAKADQPAIYEALYKIKSEETKVEDAYAYLEEGRKRFPDDISLLFAEINHFLQIGQLDVLINKLKEGIEKEPDNISLYSTLGNVYDNLYQKEVKDGNEEKAQEYFDLAKQYYGEALVRKPDFVDAVYSIGALYYNKAAGMTVELNKLADDYSKAGIAKYEKLKSEIFAEFDKALPYFQQAEMLDPNDFNTLLALREIYARKDDLETSNVFKERLDKLQDGQKIEESYFKKQ
jgi:tetratricopeptide (TPR) repeat protein